MADARWFLLHCTAFQSGQHAAMAPPRKEAEQLVRLVATLGKVRVEPVQLKLL